MADGRTGQERKRSDPADVGWEGTGLHDLIRCVRNVRRGQHAQPDRERRALPVQIDQQRGSLLGESPGRG